MFSIRKIVVLIVLILAGSLAEEVIITNSSTKMLDEATLKKIYLGKKKAWENGEKIILTTLKKGETHESFMLRLINRRPEQFTIYWKQLMFTGRGIMPKEFASEQEMVDFIAANHGAIGYISDGDSIVLPEEVTVIQIQ